MTTTYRTRDILTTRIGDQVKVEILADDDTTLPNYGTVSPWEAEDGTPAAYWSVASGQSGTAETERKAVHAAARAIRAHHKRHALEREAASAARVEAERTRSVQQLDPASVQHTSDHGTYRVLSAAHHRNGIGGTPFFVGVLAYDEGDFAGQRMHVVVVPTPHTTGEDEGEPNPDVFWPDIYVTDVDLAAGGNVRFGENSWRGDRFQSEARTIVTRVHA